MRILNISCDFRIDSKLFWSNFRSDIETLQFQMTFEIPRIRVKAQYRSTGVLILVKASGAGDYWGEYGKLHFRSKNCFIKNEDSNVFCFIRFLSWRTEGVRAKVYFKASPVDQQDDLTYLRVDEAKMDFSVKEIRMGVDNVANANPVIRMFCIIYFFEILFSDSIFLFKLLQRLLWIYLSTAMRKNCWKKWNRLYAPNWQL